MAEKRFTKRTIDNWESYIVDGITDQEYGSNINKLLELLNELADENKELNEENQKLDEKVCLLTMDLVTTKSYKQLEKENERLKRTISKIDFAIIRKYDNSLENLLDEVYDGEYNKWIKKQLSRAKKLDGDDGI